VRRDDGQRVADRRFIGSRQVAIDFARERIRIGRVPRSRNGGAT
jgi:hypothetical protein